MLLSEYGSEHMLDKNNNSNSQGGKYALYTGYNFPRDLDRVQRLRDTCKVALG